MDRAAAIEAVVGAWMQIANEFCVGEQERRANDQECYDVLTALGCTSEEIEEAGLILQTPDDKLGDGGYPRDPEVRAAIDRLGADCSVSPRDEGVTS